MIIEYIIIEREIYIENVYYDKILKKFKYKHFSVYIHREI